MNPMTWQDFTVRLHGLIVEAEASIDIYKPALATALRIEADALADRHPDDTNGGSTDG